jgi:exopolyphosphatase / guanosine-5'-triphosphate,3'-diphosphate pyrophosphatase
LIFGAIDIGSNAGRLLIGNVQNGITEATVKKIALVRVPLRLGLDVFEDKKISRKRIKMLIKTLKAFKHLLDVYEVETFRAVATSAFREAENRKEVLDMVKDETGIALEVIAGEEEADLILANFFTQKLDHQKSYLYIDVGGGSTEISLIENEKKVDSQSFKMGTIRILKNQVPDKRWIEMKDWVKTLNPNHKEIIAVGTGGNINRILKVNKADCDYISYSEIKKVQAHLASYSLEDRIDKLGLRPDRADVIIPAADIYLAIMRYAEIKIMLVPKIGLSDGIIFDLYRKTKKALVK